MDSTQPLAQAPPQLSPDGRWWWDGRQWLAVPAPVPAPAPAPRQFSAPPSADVWAFRGPTRAAPAGPDVPALASLVLSLLWLGGLGSLAAVVLGHLSRRRARAARREPSSVALVGLIIGYVGVAFTAMGVLAAVAIPVFLNQRVAADRAVAMTNLRQVDAAEQAQHQLTGRYVDLGTLEGQDPAASSGAAPAFYPSGGAVVDIVTASASRYCATAQVQSLRLSYDSGSGVVRVGACG